jgi:hypothetical protein
VPTCRTGRTWPVGLGSRSRSNRVDPAAHLGLLAHDLTDPDRVGLQARPIPIPRRIVGDSESERERARAREWERGMEPALVSTASPWLAGRSCPRTPCIIGSQAAIHWLCSTPRGPLPKAAAMARPAGACRTTAAACAAARGPLQDCARRAVAGTGLRPVARVLDLLSPQRRGRGTVHALGLASPSRSIELGSGVAMAAHARTSNCPSLKTSCYPV